MILPPIDQLIERCRALAALDLILSPEWQYRYYSFNSHWSDAEQMASMRDGCGSEWWIVFHRDGWAGLKGLDHESSAWSKHRERLSSALQRALPIELASFSSEPAFRWDATSFAYFHTIGAGGWTRVNNLTSYFADDGGERELLALLVGQPSDYATFAADYYETDINDDLVEDIFALRPLTDAIVKALNPSATLHEISGELYDEIQYPGTEVA
jgi:hypothetical protein